MKRNCRCARRLTADEYTFATVLAYNYNTIQARTNNEKTQQAITNNQTVFRKDIGVIEKSSFSPKKEIKNTTSNH